MTADPLPRVALPADFLRIPIAHRGLHDMAEGRVENSLSAARAAMVASSIQRLNASGPSCRPPSSKTIALGAKGRSMPSASSRALAST